MTFSLQPSDTTLKRSVVPMAIAFMFDGGINLFSKPQLFFKGDKFRIFGKFSYKNTQENYYGIGYTTNKDYVRSDTTSQYRYSGVQINPWFLFRPRTSPQGVTATAIRTSIQAWASSSPMIAATCPPMPIGAFTWTSEA